MVRKQIYLDERTNNILKKMALLKKASSSSLIREAINEYLDKMFRNRRKEDNPLYRVVGLCEDGKSDASMRHDEYLYQMER
ncbi:MAG: CopG family transcriptional regulator [bacterium]|nr:CopG family transcriptional regulator [bacterium]